MLIDDDLLFEDGPGAPRSAWVINSNTPSQARTQHRHRPVDEVIHEMENCGARTISINDARLFRYAGAAQGGDARVEGSRHPMAGWSYFKTGAGRPHARARGRKRLHYAEHWL